MDIISTLFHLQSRRIGIIIPDVVISEKHSDALEITEHPVEVGAAISDHAYRRPAEVVMELGFAGGGYLFDFADVSTATGSLGLSPREVYENIIKLQRERTPFDVVTGKRLYQNMLLRNVEVTTDRTSENVLMAVLTLREIIITSTSTVQVADKSNMTEGVNTSAVENSGVKTPTKPNESIVGKLNNATGGFIGGVLSFIGVPVK